MKLLEAVRGETGHISGSTFTDVAGFHRLSKSFHPFHSCQAAGFVIDFILARETLFSRISAAAFANANL